ncbi:MAG TPA: hypothetical protein VEU62_15890 [Bryobacterales bacterium]|nr:hypothetical protein [Bryobacterales bacterium]
MKTLIVLVLAACLGVWAAETPAARPSLASVHKVYLMPMAGGLDQYLAEQLTAQGPLTVVVDPKQADAVWSEQVDPAFGDTLEAMYPPAKAAKPKKDDGAIQQDQPQKRSFGRGRGNIFLVAVGSRQVIWSTYLKPNDHSPKALHRAAGTIIKQLKKDLGAEQ